MSGFVLKKSHVNFFFFPKLFLNFFFIDIQALKLFFLESVDFPLKLHSLKIILILTK